MRRRVHVLPLDLVTRAVRAEHGACRIFQIARWVVTQLFYDLLLLPAGPVAADAQLDASAAPCIGRKLRLILPQQPHRRASAQNGLFPFLLRRLIFALHPLDIRDRPAHARRGSSMRNAYHGSSSTDCAFMRPCRTAR